MKNWGRFWFGDVRTIPLVCPWEIYPASKIKDISILLLEKRRFFAAPFFEVSIGLSPMSKSCPFFRSPCLSSVCSIFTRDFYCRCTSTGLFFRFFMALRRHLGYIYEKKTENRKQQISNFLCFRSKQKRKMVMTMKR